MRLHTSPNQHKDDLLSSDITSRWRGALVCILELIVGLRRPHISNLRLILIMSLQYH